MSSIFEYLSYGEFTRLVVCLSLDLVEYVIPILLTPFVGDLFDIIGLSIALYLFGWMGLLDILELIPGLDFLPINFFTWVIWMFTRRWGTIENTFSD